MKSIKKPLNQLLSIFW